MLVSTLLFFLAHLLLTMQKLLPVRTVASTGLLAAVVVLLALAGCSREEERIERYKFPNVSTAVASPAPTAAGDAARTGKDRMLGAMVLGPSQGWFFKLTGPADEVAKQAEPFEKFVRSVRLSDAAQGPTWTLPEGWTEQPGSGIRFATIKIQQPGKPLELSVTALPRPPGDEGNYALSNLNRWRDQMGLGPIAQQQLPEHSPRIEVAGHPVYLVSIVGTLKSGMTGAPFAR